MHKEHQLVIQIPQDFPPKEDCGKGRRKSAFKKGEPKTDEKAALVPQYIYDTEDVNSDSDNIIDK